MRAEPKSPKESVGWQVFDRRGRPASPAFGVAVDAREYAEWHRPDAGWVPWRELYDKGYRCLPVTVIPGRSKTLWRKTRSILKQMTREEARRQMNALLHEHPELETEVKGMIACRFGDCDTR